MKRTLALILALVLCLSFAACGKETAGNTNTEENVQTLYNVGKTISTEQVEFVITNYGFYTCLSNIGDENYLMPIEEDDEDAWLYYVDNNPYNVDDEHIMLQFEYEYKNVGKEEMNEIDRFKLEYSDGYTFDVDGRGQRDDGSFGGLGSIEPLTDKIIARAAVKLPIEVFENENEPIVVKLTLPSTGEEFSIKLR